MIRELFHSLRKICFTWFRALDRATLMATGEEPVTAAISDLKV